uniref:sodium/calcium exchanger 3-like n=1 Tax=Myxine glutinosa TaxID=7769 RepID=UPI00358F5A45
MVQTLDVQSSFKMAKRSLSFSGVYLYLDIIVVLFVCTTPITAESLTAPANQTTCKEASKCSKGIFLPVWNPDSPSLENKILRAIVYFMALLYTFLGVSIIADRFMASIEVITSKEKVVVIKKANGETTTTSVPIWNETVSNLTLMALGSSAPEILLSVIEVCGHGFEAGELGPNTIVGSAAFNMFVIIAVCIYIIPDGEVRRVKHPRVFFVTTAWSIFAYIWLYLILAVISPNVVDVWEGLLTLSFFPICVIIAWMTDRRLFFTKGFYREYRTNNHKGIIVESEGSNTNQHNGIEIENKTSSSHNSPVNESHTVDMENKEEEELRKEMINILKELKHKYPDKQTEQLTEMANYHLLNHQQKSRAFYRIHATRQLTGAGNILKKHAVDQARKGELEQRPQEHTGCKIFFNPWTYRCLENCGSCTLKVARTGDLDSAASVVYRTEDGTANAGSDYIYNEGTLTFLAGEDEKEILVGIVNDDIFEEDEHFFVRLSNVKTESTEIDNEPNHNITAAARIESPFIATVTIIDDDHAGVFTFEGPLLHISENVGTLEVKVFRNTGARGRIGLPYHTVDGTAKSGGIDYEGVIGCLEFDNDEILKIIKIRIIDDEEYEKNKNLFLMLGEPRSLESKSKDSGLTTEQVAAAGKPGLGEHTRLEIMIEESYEFKSVVDKLVKKTNLSLLLGTHSWREQFVEAITITAGSTFVCFTEEEDGTQKKPSCSDYLIHMLTLFWKVIFACVPPTEYWSGWACFLVCILAIGFLTTLIGDLASHFGCTIGLKDSVNAVVFVALGTSVPDTFASKVAAVNDKYADASIGNVTGSNAVNVFLGIGLAWSIAAIYWFFQGKQFRVDPGTLAFSVTLYTAFALICIAVLIIRRRPSIGGELGGPRTIKMCNSLFFVLLWIVYILVAGLEAYCHIKVF